ncbi:17413_t:CDS:1, partial [Rhizophagus irregularis]
ESSNNNFGELFFILTTTRVYSTSYQNLKPIFKQLHNKIFDEFE